MRGKIKKAVVRVVDRAYGLHPSDSTFSTTDPKALRAEKRKFIAQKVGHLLGDEAPFLRGHQTEVNCIRHVKTLLTRRNFHVRNILLASRSRIRQLRN